MNVKRLMATAGLVVAAASFAAVAAVPGAALADAADTPVGRLIAKKSTCEDHGATVTVAVTGGMSSTWYEASPVNGPLAWSDGFTSDAWGAGLTKVHNVRPDVEPFIGRATITVTANGKSGQVGLWIDCPSAKD